MSTIAPSRLKNVENAALHVSLVQDNMEILAEEIAKRIATYQSGTPTTDNGPPTTGARELGEFWRDALGGEYVCTVAGTPGTWKQITPAPVTTDPSAGPDPDIIPVGYLILDVTDGAIKRYTGSYIWEHVIGQTTTEKVGFHGAATTYQRSGADQAAAVYVTQTITDPPTAIEVQAINDGLVSVLTLLNELRAALVAKGLIKGAA